MALTIAYTFKGEAKQIAYANDKYHDIYEAMAAAEGIDLTAYLAMARQVAAMAKKARALTDYRDNQFREFGFSDIRVIKE